MYWYEVYESHLKLSYEEENLLKTFSEADAIEMIIKHDSWRLHNGGKYSLLDFIDLVNNDYGDMSAIPLYNDRSNKEKFERVYGD